jgi:hypothetical protein
MWVTEEVLNKLQRCIIVSVSQVHFRRVERAKESDQIPVVS